MPIPRNGSGPRTSPDARGPSLAARGAFEGLRDLAREAPVTVRVNGDCMAPAAVDGAAVDIAPAFTYWPGDVLAFRDAEGRILLHRLLGWRLQRGGLRWVTAADAARRPDSPLRGREILGRLRGGECDQRLIDVPLGDRLWAVGRFLKFGIVALRRRIFRTAV